MRNWITLCENSLTPRFPESTATLKDGSVVELSADETTEPLGDPDEDDFGETFLHVYAKINGHTIGSAQIPYEDSAFRGLAVDDDFRRLGVATALYDYAEKLLGYKLRPSDNLEPDGEAFWKARLGESADLLEYKMFNVTYYGTDHPLFENPTRSELAGMVGRADRRGVVDGKNLFIANAGMVVHEDIVKMAFSIGRWEGTTYEGVNGLKPTYTRSQSSYFYDPTQNLASKFKDEWVGSYAERDCGVKTLAISPTLYVAFFENAEETVMATPAFARLVRGAEVVSFINPKPKVYSPEEDDELLRQLAENVQSWPETIEGWQLANSVQNLHHTPEDFHDGDIHQNIAAFGVYHLKRIPLDTLKRGRFTIFDDLVDEYAILETDPPPIIVDPTHGFAIDGNHRIEAAVKRGESDILAYVGDPNTYEAPEDDDDGEWHPDEEW